LSQRAVSLLIRKISMNKYVSDRFSFSFATRVENNYYDCVIIESQSDNIPVGLEIAMMKPPQGPDFIVSAEECCDEPTPKFGKLSVNKYISDLVSFTFATRVENNYYDCVIIYSEFSEEYPTGFKFKRMQPHEPDSNPVVLLGCKEPITKDKTLEQVKLDRYEYEGAIFE
jgi:hypothetical protein